MCQDTIGENKITPETLRGRLAGRHYDLLRGNLTKDVIPIGSEICQPGGEKAKSCVNGDFDFDFDDAPRSAKSNDFQFKRSGQSAGRNDTNGEVLACGLSDSDLQDIDAMVQEAEAERPEGGDVTGRGT